MDNLRAIAAVRSIDDALAEARKKGASDVQLVADGKGALRINGEMQPGGSAYAFEMAALTSFLEKHVSDEGRARLARDQVIDASDYIVGVGRVRIHAFFAMKKLRMDVRLLAPDVMSLEALDTPPMVARLLGSTSHGMILVTGPTGSGKSTLQAAMVDFINHKFAHHIVTIEDPIEYAHHSDKAFITQKEVGTDVPSFQAGLVASLREDPDVILVGEMRDRDTLATALTAAETGHLVMGTLHTKDTASTISRFIDVFPADQQEMVRTQLIQNLRATIAIRLVPKVGGGRRSALEVCILNDAVRGAIKNADANAIREAVRRKDDPNMLALERHLGELVRRGEITDAAARAAAVVPDDVALLQR